MLKAPAVQGIEELHSEPLETICHRGHKPGDREFSRPSFWGATKVKSVLTNRRCRFMIEPPGSF